MRANRVVICGGKAKCDRFDGQTKQQISWLLTRIKQAAPQTLVVAN